MSPTPSRRARVTSSVRPIVLQSLALLALPIALGACRKETASSSTSTSHPAASHDHEATHAAQAAPAEAPKAAAHAGGVKPALRGLLSMGAYKFVADWGEPVNSLDTVRKKAGLLQGIVLLATWRGLEKSATSGLTENNTIDQGLAEVRKYNQEHPSAPLAVKLRVWGGFWAPEWVMEQSGGAFPITHTNNKGAAKQRKLGHVWSAPYRKAWAHLQELLAAKYDAEPLIHEVAVTSCMMFTAEPFSIDTSAAAVKALHDAGMTDAAYKACLDGIVQDYAPWKTTRFETPLNPFKLTDGAKAKHDEAFTLDWLKRCHAAEPARCAFDNHDLDTKLPADLATTYAAMKSSGAEVEFQTGPEMPADLDGTIRRAVETGGLSVELYQDYKGFPEMADADLKKYAKMLVDNRP